MQVDFLVSMCIGFGLCNMFVVEADLQLQFYRVVPGFVGFSKRLTLLNSFSTNNTCV